jgi:hypothetical protein
MSLTQEQATDEILTVFKAAWDTTGYDVFYENVREDPSVVNDPYATTQIRHVASRQATLAGYNGSRMFERVGRFVVQVFSPVGIGLSAGYDLGIILLNAFEGVATPGGVWFRNANFREIGRDSALFQWNFEVEFLYHEIR